MKGQWVVVSGQWTVDSGQWTVDNIAVYKGLILFLKFLYALQDQFSRINKEYFI